MAYVGISEALKRRISSKLNYMQNQELGRLKATLYPFTQLPLTGPAWGAFIERVAWGAHAGLRDVLPDDWVAHVGRLDLKIFDGDVQLESVRYEGPEILLPPPFRSGYSYYTPDLQLDVADLDPELAANLKRYHAAITANSERYTVAGEHLNKLLSRCKSLNEAVELYPDLKFFLEDDILEKLERRRGKEEKGPDPRLDGVDTALITSAAVIGNLNQGNG